MNLRAPNYPIQHAEALLEEPWGSLQFDLKLGGVEFSYEIHALAYFSTPRVLILMCRIEASGEHKFGRLMIYPKGRGRVNSDLQNHTLEAVQK